MSKDTVVEWLMLDSTVVRARRKKDEGNQALGCSPPPLSWGGFSSKVHAVCDALGLIDGIKTKAVLADRDYDSDAILETIGAKRAEAVIPPHPVRSGQRETDWFLYKERHKIEVMFGHMTNYRRVFARFENLPEDTSLLSISQLSA